MAWCISNVPSLQDRFDKSLQHCRTQFFGTPAGHALACGTSLMLVDGPGCSPCSEIPEGADNFWEHLAKLNEMGLNP